MKARRPIEPIPSALELKKRVATYFRVSTGRQFTHNASVPSQRRITSAFCELNNYQIVDEFVEAKTASDERRPILQEMIDRACAPDHPYDAVVFYAFNRFYRNSADQEITIRKLDRHGVEAISATQPTGTEPSQILLRQIIGVVDEHASRENAKNTARSMRESARQGFWNGSVPPLGYKSVEAEHRGHKIKKKLAIEPVEAELVRLISKLYLHGDSKAGPLGVKGTTKWLNHHGYRTRRGAYFGVGTVHQILTRTCYATGLWPYGIRKSRNRGLHDPSTIIYIPVPILIEQAVFEAVQAKLEISDPKITPPRVTNGPTLLTGIAICASCGSSMTRTATTNRYGQLYTYYSCANAQKKGKSTCKGRNIPTKVLDEIVLASLKQRVLASDRISNILKSLKGRQSAKAASANRRILDLQHQLGDAEDRLKRVYRSIEDGVVELDDILRDRVAGLKSLREKTKAALEHAQAQHGAATVINAQKIDAFARLMKEKLESADINARKGYIRSIVDAIEVGDKIVRIIGNKEVLQAAVANQQTENGEVRGFVRKWRARKDCTPHEPQA